MITKTLNNLFYKSLLFAVFLSFFHTAYSQTFTADKQGFVADPAFKDLITKKGCQLVSAFDTLHKKPLVIAARVMVDGKWQMMDNHGKLFPDPETSFRNDMVSGGNFGDEIGIPYDDYMDKDPYKQVNINGKYGTINKKTGDEGIPPVYDGLSFFRGGLVEIRSGDKLGLALSSGKVIKQPQYEQISSMVFDFKNKDVFFLQVKKDGKYGLLDSKGEEIISPSYDQIRDCAGCDVKKNLLLVAKDKRWGIVSKTGNLIVEPVYVQISPLTFKGQMSVMVKDGGEIKYGLIDSAGKVLMQPIYNKLVCSYGTKMITMTVVTAGVTNYGLADYNGKIILPAVYQRISEFRNGLAVINKDEKYGVINSTGKIIVEAIYDRFQIDPTSSYILVKKDGKFGAFDLNGTLVIPVVNYELLVDNSKHYVFRKDDKWSKGTIGVKSTTPLTYDHIAASNNYLVVEKDGKAGVVDLSGKIIFPIKYDKFRDTNHVVQQGLAIAIIDGKNYIIDRYGNEYLRDR